MADAGACKLQAPPCSSTMELYGAALHVPNRSKREFSKAPAPEQVRESHLVLVPEPRSQGSIPQEIRRKLDARVASRQLFPFPNRLDAGPRLHPPLKENQISAMDYPRPLRFSPAFASECCDTRPGLGGLSRSENVHAQPSRYAASFEPLRPWAPILVWHNGIM